ncbi:MAG: F0F1 ATP synthase subunit B [Alphaproteobacteria bacterium]|nr:F0F1 ATP synthase subunit B [Alphaproteobacteria bacterium]
MAADAAAEHGAGHSTPILQDTSFWVSLGFLVVVGLLLYMGAHTSITKALDARAQRISDELDEARRLREEAQELLAQYQRRQREAEDEAQAIVEQAKRDAKRLAASMREKINEQIDRREKSAAQKIARAEAQAITEIRGQIVDAAVNATQIIIRDRMDQSAQSALAEKALDDLRARLN